MEPRYKAYLTIGSAKARLVSTATQEEGPIELGEPVTEQNVMEMFSSIAAALCQDRCAKEDSIREDDELACYLIYPDGCKRIPEPLLMTAKRNQPCQILPLTQSERAYIDKLMTDCGRRSFRAKQCYTNAQRLIGTDSEKWLRYWEGLLDGAPHAWVTINNKVVDVTQEAAQRQMKRWGYKVSDSVVKRYSGVCINRRAVLSSIVRTGWYRAVRPPHFPRAITARLARQTRRMLDVYRKAHPHAKSS